MFSPFQGTMCPDNIRQHLIEVIPDHVLAAYPRFIHRKTGQEVKIPVVILDRVTRIIRQAWCYARMYGRAYISMDEGLAGTTNYRIGGVPAIEDSRLITSISNQNSYYMQTYKSLAGVIATTGKSQVSSQIINHLAFDYLDQPLIDEKVDEAWCLYSEVVNSVAIRIKNSLQSLLSIYGEDEESMMGVPPQEVMNALDAQYAQSRRMYAPEGSKLQGVSVSIEGVKDAVDTYWIHLGHTAKIPKWMMLKDPGNSSFVLEEREEELIKYWRQYCSEAYYSMFTSLGLPKIYDIHHPDYRTETHRAMRDDLVSQAEQRRATSEKLIVGTIAEETKIKNNWYRDPLTMAKKTAEISAANQPEVKPVNVKDSKDTKSAKRTVTDGSKEDLTQKIK